MPSDVASCEGDKGSGRGARVRRTTRASIGLSPDSRGVLVAPNVQSLTGMMLDVLQSMIQLFILDHLLLGLNVDRICNIIKGRERIVMDMRGRK